MTENEAFQTRVAQALADIDPDTLSYDESIAANGAQTYAYIEQYARDKCLYNTAVALPLLRGFLASTGESSIPLLSHSSTNLSYYMHDLSIGRLLVDLHLPLSAQDEDLVISAGLCHVLPELISFPNRGTELYTQFHLDPQVYQLLKTITRHGPMAKPDQEQFFDAIQKNPLALIIKLADRSNLLEQLHTGSLSECRSYVHETRVVFFPMCIYGKEHYSSIRGVISILMEKMRSLADVTDILTTRYQAREEALTSEILTLQEENSRIRMAIAKLEEERAAQAD